MGCLIVPGLGSSGADHWQSRWERERGDCRRVELGEWDDPVRARWIEGVDDAVAAFEGAPILVALSLGCHAVAFWARDAGERAGKVTGAVLVARPMSSAPMQTCVCAASCRRRARRCRSPRSSSRAGTIPTPASRDPRKWRRVGRHRLRMRARKGI